MLKFSSEEFVTAAKEKLGFKAKGREVVGRDGSFELVHTERGNAVRIINARPATAHERKKHEV